MPLRSGMQPLGLLLIASTTLASCQQVENTDRGAPECGEFTYQLKEIEGAGTINYAQLLSRDFGLLDDIDACFKLNPPPRLAGLELIFDANSRASNGDHILAFRIDGVSHSEFYVIVGQDNKIQGSYTVAFDE